MMTSSRIGALSLLCLIAPTFSAQQPIPLSGSTSGLMQDLNADPRPEPEWDVVGTFVIGMNNVLLVRNDDANDAARLAENIRISRQVYEEIVFDQYGVQQTTTGDLDQIISNGTMYAMEVDFFDSGYNGVVNPTLGQDALLEHVELLDDASQPIGYVYFYDQAMYTARSASVVSSTRSVFLGDLVHTSNTGNQSMRILGNDNSFHGPVRSSGKLQISGFGQVFTDGVFWSKSFLNLQPGAATFTDLPLKVGGTAQRSTPEVYSWYENQPNSLVLSGDLTLFSNAGVLTVTDGTQNFLADGKIIVTTGTIDVVGTGLTGSVTLVADGEVSISASSSMLDAASTDLLLWSRYDRISVDGSANVLTGRLYSGALTSFAGSNNSLTGLVDALKFKVTGGFNSISNGAY